MAFKSVLQSVVRYFRNGMLRKDSRGKRGLQRQSRLCVEYLESRELLAAPVISAVTPTDGASLSTGTPTIAITFSEAMRLDFSKTEIGQRVKEQLKAWNASVEPSRNVSDSTDIE